MNSNLQDPHVINIYNQFKSWSDGTKELNSSAIIVLIPQIIKCVEEEIINVGKGEYKKNLTIQVLKLIVSDSKLTEEAKLALYMLIEDTAPATIDIMILIAKKKIDLGKKLKIGCISFFS